ncbi:MAG TPA: hypothetical protein VIF64_09995 [Pyrinomonadaceae bacterium]
MQSADLQVQRERIEKAIHVIRGDRVMLDADLVANHDRQIRGIFDAIRQLLTPPLAKVKPIGFRPKALKK